MPFSESESVYIFILLSELSLEFWNFTAECAGRYFEHVYERRRKILHVSDDVSLNFLNNCRQRSYYL